MLFVGLSGCTPLLRLLLTLGVVCLGALKALVGRPRFVLVDLSLVDLLIKVRVMMTAE